VAARCSGIRRRAQRRVRRAGRARGLAAGGCGETWGSHGGTGVGGAWAWLRRGRKAANAGGVCCLARASGPPQGSARSTRSTSRRTPAHAMARKQPPGHAGQSAPHTAGSHHGRPTARSSRSKTVQSQWADPSRQSELSGTDAALECRRSVPMVDARTRPLDRGTHICIQSDLGRPRAPGPLPPGDPRRWKS